MDIGAKGFLGGLIVGLVTGTGGTFFIMKYLYEKRMKEVREVYSSQPIDISKFGPQDKSDDEKVEETISVQKEKAKQAVNKPELNKYASLVNGYATPPAAVENTSVDFISSDDFGMDEVYKKEELFFYEDEVLANENGDIIDDPFSIVGDFQSHFDDYEEDVCIARNVDLKTDYYIMKCLKTYEESLQDSKEE